MTLSLKILLFVLLNVAMLGCGSSVSNDQHDINIIVKSKADSSELAFCTVLLLNKNGSIEETVCDINGGLHISKTDDVEKLVLRCAGYFPKMAAISILRLDSVVFLNKNYNSQKTAGMEFDSTLNRMNDSIELKIQEWKRK